MTVEQIAQVCHGANRAYCDAIGDHSQVDWNDAPDWQKTAAFESVQHVLSGETPAQLHESWCASKVRDGWSLGDVKDAGAKTHTCLVPYPDLPLEQRLKDALFHAVVNELR